MTAELLTKAQTLRDDIKHVTEAKRELECYISNGPKGCGISVLLKNDWGKDEHICLNADEDTITAIVFAIRNALADRQASLEKEFKEL